MEKLRSGQGLPALPAAAAMRTFAFGTSGPGAPGAAGMAMLFSDKLVFETEDAKTRKVTVKGENLTLDEAIEAIAKASICNIFKDGGTMVVVLCGQQQ